MGFKWRLPGSRSSSTYAQYPQGYCCGQTDRQLCFQPRQAFLCDAKAPGLLGFPLVALQEHPAGASLGVAMEMRLRRSLGAVPLWAGATGPPPYPSPLSWLPQEIKVILGLH